MRATNTIPNEEYTRRLFEATRKISKVLARLSDEEEMKSRAADNKGDEETALKHDFRARAYRNAVYYLLKNTPTATAESDNETTNRRKNETHKNNLLSV